MRFGVKQAERAESLPPLVAFLSGASPIKVHPRAEMAARRIYGRIDGKAKANNLDLSSGRWTFQVDPRALTAHWSSDNVADGSASSRGIPAFFQTMSSNGIASPEQLPASQ